MNAEHARQRVSLRMPPRQRQERRWFPDVVETMNGISASSQQIAEITTVINSIASASIFWPERSGAEAARAGEQGRGFAVVAGEAST